MNSFLSRLNPFKRETPKETPEEIAKKFKSLILEKIEEIKKVSRPPQIYETLLTEIDNKLKDENLIKIFNESFFLNQIRILCYNDYNLFEYFYNRYYEQKRKSIELSQMEISIIMNFLYYIQTNRLTIYYPQQYPQKYYKEYYKKYYKEYSQENTTDNYTPYYQQYSYYLPLNINGLIIVSNYSNINYNIELYLNRNENTITLQDYYYLLDLFNKFKYMPYNIYKCNYELNQLINEYQKKIEITRNEYQLTQWDAYSRGGRRKKKVLKQYK